MSQQVRNHPLESVFGMNAGTMSFEVDNEMMEIPAQEVVTTQPVVEDDGEDIEIKEQITEIYTIALEAYKNQSELTEIIEPRYAARTAEVANAYLNTALSAVALRSKNKTEKHKRGQSMPGFGPNISNSNVIVADRNQLLEMMAEKRRLANEG